MSRSLRNIVQDFLHPLLLKKDNDVLLNDIMKESSYFFAIGSAYGFTLDIENSALIDCSDSLLEVHGLTKQPKHLRELINLVHPDDFPFLMDAETWVMKKYNEACSRKQSLLKAGYSFRMKTKGSTYELFYHEAYYMVANQSNNYSKSLHIQTNVNHIATLPNFIVRAELRGSDIFHYQEKLSLDCIVPDITTRLTKRELEIFLLLIKGHSDREIAETLYVSYHTVRTHHKNILKKTKTKNSKELIKRSLKSD